MTMTPQDLKTRRFKWPVFVPIVLAILLLAGWFIMENQRKLNALKAEEDMLRLQLSAGQAEEQNLRLKLSGVGSTSALDNEARALSFVKPGELRFEIISPQLLDKYTEAEWAIMMQERQLGFY